MLLKKSPSKVAFVTGQSGGRRSGSNSTRHRIARMSTEMPSTRPDGTSHHQLTARSASQVSLKRMFRTAR